MNKISKQLNLEFDINGAIAKRGKLIPELLEKLNNLAFFKQKPPKSLGREWVEKFINPLFLKNYKANDILNTFCEHIGIQIGQFLNDKSAFFTGGGVCNSYLMNRISYYSKSEFFIDCLNSNPNQSL